MYILMKTNSVDSDIEANPLEGYTEEMAKQYLKTATETLAKKLGLNDEMIFSNETATAVYDAKEQKSHFLTIDFV